MKVSKAGQFELELPDGAPLEVFMRSLEVLVVGNPPPLSQAQREAEDNEKHSWVHAYPVDNQHPKL